MADEILYEKSTDRIGLITLNRPQSMNAVDRALTRQFRDVIRATEADADIDVVIITGAGEKAFCVGVDLKERQTLSDDEAFAFRMGELFPMYEELEGRQKPSIALVRGHCLGGGFEIALACDMILATADAKFGLPEVKWGLIPAGGGCRKLPKLIGAARAKEVILTGRGFDALQAERMGVINRVVSAETALQEANDLAKAVAGNVQVAVRGAKRSIDQALDFKRTIPFDLEVSNYCYASKERKAGISNFVTRKQTEIADK